MNPKDTKAELIAELAAKYGKEHVITSDPHDYIHEGLNPAEFLSHFVHDLEAALDRYEQTVRKECEEENGLAAQAAGYFS